MGRHPDATFCCRLFIPVEYARIAYAWASLFEPSDGRDPDLYTVQLPDYERDRDSHPSRHRIHRSTGQ